MLTEDEASWLGGWVRKEEVQKWLLVLMLSLLHEIAAVLMHVCIVLLH